MTDGALSFESANYRPGEAGFEITLMDRVLKTPKGNHFAVPNEHLAEAIAEEWRSQNGPKIHYPSLPLSRLSFGSIDVVPQARDRMVAELVDYIETDLVFFRAEQPATLRARQDSHLTPLCSWLSQQCSGPVEITEGIRAVPQDQSVNTAIRAALEDLDCFQLTAADLAARLTGSVCIAFAILRGDIEAEDGWNASRVDEEWQIERWGRDAEAEARAHAKKLDFLAAHKMIRLLQS